MARAVGIDIGSKSLKILELERSGSRFRITFFHNIEIPFGSDSDSASDVLAETIKNIFEQYHLESDNVALALPTQESVLREITVDFKDDNHIRQTIKYEAEKHLQAYEIDDVVVDYQKLQIVGEKTKLFVVAVPKKILAQRLKLLESCHVDPMIMDLDIMGIVNVCRFVPETVSHDNIAILDFGAGSTKLVILNKGQLRHVRAIRSRADVNRDTPNPQSVSQREINLSGNTEEIDWGMENELIVSLAMPDGIETERMVMLKKDPNDPDINQQKKKEEFFKRVIRELGRTMMSLHLDEPINLFCICGGGSLLEGLREKIERAFHIPTIPLDFSQVIQCPSDTQEEITVTAPIALGLAMELLDNDCQTMNFRKEEYSYTNRFELMKTPLAFLVSLLLILLIAVSYGVYQQRKSYEVAYNKLLGDVKNVCERVYGQDSFSGTKFSKISSFYSKISREVSAQKSDLPEVEDAFIRWQILASNFSKIRDRYNITIDHLSIDPKEATWEGEVEYDGILDELNQVIRSIKTHVDANTDRTRATGTNNNPKPSEPNLKRRYNFQVGFKIQENKDDF